MESLSLKSEDKVNPFSTLFGTLFWDTFLDTFLGHFFGTLLVYVPSESFSPESGGKVKPSTAMEAMRTQGTMRLKK